MNGQWLGTFSSSVGNGRVIVNVDERETNYEGTGYFVQDNKQLPSSAVGFKTASKNQHFEMRSDWVLPIDPVSTLIAPWENVKSYYPDGTAFSTYADITGDWSADQLSVSWTTDLGVTGSCVLPRSNATKPSELVGTEQNWGEYKHYVSTLKNRRYLFRGQSKPWRLRTSFHRTGRADLNRFLREDIPALHRHLSARTKHVFNLSIPDENGAFFNLVQHHGYPTPLLDWTYSPYVAAFFAYRNVAQNASTLDTDEKVRILIFDQAGWRQFQQFQILVLPWPHLSIGEFIAIENERMIPQQAASTVTNLDDIESYVKSKESGSTRYLTAIDLPIRDRADVLRDLRYMGITAGSLFPGLDGMCEELAQRNFEI